MSDKERLVERDEAAAAAKKAAGTATASTAASNLKSNAANNDDTSAVGPQPQPQQPDQDTVAAYSRATTDGIRLRVITLGDTAVGKTSILARFMYDAYDRHYRATLGIDYLTKRVQIHGVNVNMVFYDSAGQERFRSLIPSYIRNSAGAIVVYDVSSRESFVNTTRWVEDVRQERGPDSGVVFFLVANKIDLTDQERVVTTEEGEAKARELGASYMEVSAKTGANIKSLFRKVSTSIPLSTLEAAQASSGGGGAGGAGGAGGLGLPPIRRIDPLLVTPSRPVNLQAGAGAGTGSDDAASSGYCGAC